MIPNKPIKALCGIREEQQFSYKGNTVCVDNDKLSVSGMYLCEIPFSSIEKCNYENRLIGGRIHLIVKQNGGTPNDLLFNFSNVKKAKLIFDVIRRYNSSCVLDKSK